jgi:hypothetical protein
VSLEERLLLDQRLLRLVLVQKRISPRLLRIGQKEKFGRQKIGHQRIGRERERLHHQESIGVNGHQGIGDTGVGIGVWDGVVVQGCVVGIVGCIVDMGSKVKGQSDLGQVDHMGQE